MKLTAGLAGVCAAVAVAIAGYQIHEARAAAAELASAIGKRDALVARLSEIENKIRQAERRAVESEKDSGELLKAVESVRKQQEALASASGARSSNPGMATAPGLNVQPGEEEKQRLARERAYQQALAKTRAAEAEARAELDYAASNFDGEAKFNMLIEAAGRYAANAEFQVAIRTYNQAMAAKPDDLPVSDRVRELQATLKAQNLPVEVTLNSDGDTFVSIRNYRAPAKLQTRTIKILPGNYEVIGQRSGYRDVVVMIQVRNGMPPPVVSVVCTQPAQE